MPLITATWGQTPRRVARLLGVDDDIEGPVGGKASKAGKTAQRLLEEIGAAQQRLCAWAESVFEMTWSQAQLLQVMEQIEPYVADALYDEQRLAAAAVGAYAHLLATLEHRLGEEAYPAVLALVGGQEGPEKALIEALVSGTEAESFLRRFGHRGDHEQELAEPRWSELGPPQATELAEEAAWNPAQAKQRAREALEEIAARVGWLQRNAFRRDVEVTRRLLSAHAHATDTLAYVLAAVRRWSLAAAEEARRDGERLDESAQIFWLELEEVKQMMTGEWHNRAQVQPIILERQAQWAQRDPLTPSPRSSLGVAGFAIEAPARPLDSPAAAAEMEGGHIALLPETTPAWAGVFLRAGGLATESGDLLCHTAAAARAGGVPAVVGGAFSPDKARFRLDPGQFWADSAI